MIGKSVIIVGINAAGITSKIQSFDKLLFDIKPSVFMIQETKQKHGATDMKADNLENIKFLN